MWVLVVYCANVYKTDYKTKISKINAWHIIDAIVAMIWSGYNLCGRQRFVCEDGACSDTSLPFPAGHKGYAGIVYISHIQAIQYLSVTL